MDHATEDEVGRLLEQMASGDESAAERLFPVVYGELHRIAHRLMRGERKSHTLQTTALVHEAWLKLCPQKDVTAEGRNHFLALATRAMRRVLIDHARRVTAKKRDGGERHPLLDSVLEGWDGDMDDLLALDEALERLGAEDEMLRRIVELRFYGGLTLEETGAVLGMTIRQVHRRWTTARGWLRLQLEGEADEA